jgi:hypothetical protein
VFNSPTGEERSQTLQCILKDIVLFPDKIVLNIFEIPELAPGSQNRAAWLPRSNPLRNVLSFSGEPKSIESGLFALTESTQRCEGIVRTS